MRVRSVHQRARDHRAPLGTATDLGSLAAAKIATGAPTNPAAALRKLTGYGAFRRVRSVSTSGLESWCPRFESGSRHRSRSSDIAGRTGPRSLGSARRWGPARKTASSSSRSPSDWLAGGPRGRAVRRSGRGRRPPGLRASADLRPRLPPAQAPASLTARWETGCCSSSPSSMRGQARHPSLPRPGRHAPRRSARRLRRQACLHEFGRYRPRPPRPGRDLLGPAARGVGLEWVTPHTFRHTCASLLFAPARARRRRQKRQASPGMARPPLRGLHPQGICAPHRHRGRRSRVPG